MLVCCCPDDTSAFNTLVSHLNANDAISLGDCVAGSILRMNDYSSPANDSTLLIFDHQDLNFNLRSVQTKRNKIAMNGCMLIS